MGRYLVEELWPWAGWTAAAEEHTFDAAVELRDRLATPRPVRIRSADWSVLVYGREKGPERGSPEPY